MQRKQGDSERGEREGGRDTKGEREDELVFEDALLTEFGDLFCIFYISST